MHLYTEYRTHGRLYDLGIEDIHSILGCKHGIDTEPVSDPEDRAEIARVTDCIQGKEKAS